MSAYGIPEIDIAGVLGVDPKTLRKHYRDELLKGTAGQRAQSAARKATTGQRCVQSLAPQWPAFENLRSRRAALPHVAKQRENTTNYRAAAT